MEEQRKLSTARVAILGLGLMGGSLALALRGRVREVMGADPDPAARHLAAQSRVVDLVLDELPGRLPEADIVILAAPVRGILELIAALPQLHPGSPVVIDLGSTKTQICEALRALPERFDPLGGHPMCGKETSGLAEAEAGIFQGAAFVFSPLERTTPRARTAAEQIARAVGSRPLWVDSEVHDRWVAATSQAPYLLANALSLATPAEAAEVIGPGFRSTSRLSASYAPMMRDVLVSNRENILLALNRIRDELSVLERALDQDDLQELEACLVRSAECHRRLVGGAPGGQ